MRLALDAHLCGKYLGEPLRAAGHDVLAISEHPELEGLSDAQVLELATEERRILVTRNSKDFAPLVRVWVDEGRVHAGCILIWRLPHDRFGDLIRGILAILDAHPRKADWDNISRVL